MHAVLFAVDKFHYPPPNSIIRLASWYQIVASSLNLRYAKFQLNRTSANGLKFSGKI